MAEVMILVRVTKVFKGKLGAGDAIVTGVRYKKEKGPDVFSIINESNLNQIEKWSKNGAFVINFKDIINNDIEKIDLLQQFLFNKVITNSGTAIDQAKKMDSLTKSSIR